MKLPAFARAYDNHQSSNSVVSAFEKGALSLSNQKYERDGTKLLSLPLISHSLLHQRRYLEDGHDALSYSHPSKINDRIRLSSSASIPHRLQSYRNRYHRTSSSVDDTDAFDDKASADDADSVDATDDEKDQTSALYEGYGTHYVDLWVGTPPQRQTVIVDTGSGVTAFPCSDCRNCGSGYHASAYFDESSSSSFHKFSCSECDFGGSCHNNLRRLEESCSIGVSYAEGSSWNAFQAKDLTYMGGPHSEPLPLKHVSGVRDADGADPEVADEYRFNMLFGCQTHITGLFITQLADGIMGMSNGDQSLWRQMEEANVIPNGQFSLCFSFAGEVLRSGSHAGAITMGGTDTRLHRSPMVFADALHTGDFHGLYLRSIYLVDSSVENWDDITTDTAAKLAVTEETLNSRSVILDSGTTDTYLTSSVRYAFQKAWKTFVDVAYNTNGMKLSDEQLDQLPTILFQFRGLDDNGFNSKGDDRCVGLAGCLDPDHPNDVLVAVPMQQYMTYDSSNQMYTPNIFISEPGQTVIGANTMVGHDILFDTAESSRIGFAVSDCNYTNLIASVTTEETQFPTKAPVIPKSISTQKPTAKPTKSSKTKPSPSTIKHTHGPTHKPSTAPSKQIIKIASSSSAWEAGLFIFTVSALVFICIVVRRRRDRRGRYRQTIGLDELELDVDEDLELPPVL